MERGGEAPRGFVGGLTRAIGGLSLLASRYALLTLIAVAVTSMVLFQGLGKLTTNVDVADVLPRGDGNTTAAKRLTTDFKSAFTMQVTLQFHIDETGQNWRKDDREKLPFRSDAGSSRNITDEVYIRAMAQAVAFMKEQDPLICCSIGLSDLYKLINWTVAGGRGAPDSAWEVPGRGRQGEVDYAAVNRTANAAILSALDALSSPTWKTSAQLLIPLADEEATTREIGERAIKARDAYIEWAETNPDEAFQVFTGDNFPRLTVELPVANAHSSALTKEDFSRLLPLIVGFILVVLYVAFRNIGAVLISFTALALGTLWTYGIEGYMGIALNPLNLTLMPLIMGIGIDYSIHVTNEFQEHKAKGLSHEDAFRQVGRRAGMALAIATATTVVGLVIMVFSPSLLIAEYGALASLSIVIMYFLSITFIPAALTLYPRTERMGASFRPSRIVPALARGVTLGRVVIFPVVLVCVVLGALNATTIHQEAFGDPGRNYLESDPIRQEHEHGLKQFYESPTPDIKANVLTFEGDLTDPAAHRYMRAIERELKKQPRVISDTLRTIPFLMETWLTVKGGGPGAAENLARGRLGSPPYPDTADEIRSEFDQLYGTPMKDLGSIFTNGPDGDYTLGVMTFSVRAATYPEAEQVWGQVWRAVKNASALKPDHITVGFVGNTATNYLFVAKEIPYVAYMGIASNVALLLFLLPFFRDWRSLAAIMLVNFATTAWWLGILPLFGVGLAITLVLPLIFISAIGTDYAVHLVWTTRQVGNAREVWRTTGKAILFSWITTMGPFLIFTQIQDLSVRRTMLATVLAVVLIFLCTLLIIPLFFPVGRREGDPVAVHEAPPAPTIHPAPTAVVAIKRPKPTGRPPPSR